MPGAEMKNEVAAAGRIIRFSSNAYFCDPFGFYPQRRRAGEFLNREIGSELTELERAIARCRLLLEV